MNNDSWNLCEHLLPKSYVKQAENASKTRENIIRQLIQHRKWPDNGWDDITIELFLSELSAMDSNNIISNCGVGEREARFASEIVARRHFRFGHGIGRSGDLTESQPKAVGSSLLATLTNSMLEDVLCAMGKPTTCFCILIPVATGMSMVMILLTLRSLKPSAEYVIWSRIDQKSCFKSIITAGYTPIVVDCILQGDQLVTNLMEIEEHMTLLGADKIACVITTTSCFAPRACDNVEDVGKLCKKYKIHHVVNNAYGLQSKICVSRIQRALRKGRVDAFVQSTDKNLMVPVGGSIIGTFEQCFSEKIAKMYPGRASQSPVIDAFITLLHLGKSGYMKLVEEREVLYFYLQEKLQHIASKYGQILLETPDNHISFAMTLKNIDSDKLTKIGSMLYLRNVSGTRVVTTLEEKHISGYVFKGWGSHCTKFPAPYLTAAAAIGIKTSDVDTFIKRLDRVLKKVYNVHSNGSGSNVTSSSPEAGSSATSTNANSRHNHVDTDYDYDD